MIHEHRVTARRVHSNGSEAEAQGTRPVLERVTPTLRFDLRGIGVSLHGVRQFSPPKMVRIDWGGVAGADESDRRLDLLHRELGRDDPAERLIHAA